MAFGGPFQEPEGHMCDAGGWDSCSQLCSGRAQFTGGLSAPRDSCARPSDHLRLCAFACTVMEGVYSTLKVNANVGNWKPCREIQSHVD